MQASTHLAAHLGRDRTPRRWRADMWAHRTKTVGATPSIRPSICVQTPISLLGLLLTAHPWLSFRCFPPPILQADSSDVTTPINIELSTRGGSISFFFQGAVIGISRGGLVFFWRREGDSISRLFDYIVSCDYHNLSVLVFVHYLVCIQKMCVFMHVIV